MPDDSAQARPSSSAAGLGVRRSFVLWLVAWTLTLGLGSYLRLNGLAASVVGEEIAANGPDSAYHARRMLQTWQHYPSVPAFDPLLDWPRGAVAPWPPGFDWIVATIALPASDRFGALVLISLAPVWLGIALVVLVGWAARRIAQDAAWWVGWLAASLVAIFPQAVSVARFGNPDHHVAEALIMLGLGLWSLSGWRALASGELGRARRFAFEATGAVLVGAAVAAFIGTPMYAWIAAANLAIANLLWGRGARVRWALGAPALALGAFAAALLYRTAIASHGHLFSYVYPSLLQPLLVMSAGLGCCAATALGWLFTRGARVRTLCAVLAPVLIAAVLLVPAARAACGELLHGLHEWFADRDSPLAALTENQPLFAASAQGGAFSRAHRYYGVFGLLLPLLVPAGLLAYGRRTGLRTAAPFVVWTVCIVVLMLLQNRFGRVGLVNLAICAAFVVDAAARARAWLRHAAWIAPALALAFDPPFSFYMAAEDAALPLPGIQQAGVFLREHTPPVRRGAKSGVLVPWDEAHFIVRYAERPVTATGFGVYIAPDVLDEVHRVWFGGEEQLLRFAGRHDLGFVAVSTKDFQNMRLHGQGPILGLSRGAPHWNADYFRRVPLAALLLCGSGVPDAGIGHIEHLMPRFASTIAAAGQPSLPDAWVYEIVAGALVRGRAQPNTPVRLAMRLRLRDRRIVHEAWANAGPDGSFEIRTPLPTGYNGVNFATDSHARLITAEGLRTIVTISEQAVRGGAVVRWQPAAPEGPTP